MHSMRYRPYIEFLRQARQYSKRADEAEDLLQTVLLSAVETGRTDLSLAENRRWLMGAIKKRALFDARTAGRRRKREIESVDLLFPDVDQSVYLQAEESSQSDICPLQFVRSLSPALRTTALLALSGHNKAEIAWLLRLSDAALRQRIAGIKRLWVAQNGQDLSTTSGLKGSLPFGRIRRALLKPVRQRDALLASHDLDGHLFILSSQNPLSRQQ